MGLSIKKLLDEYLSKEDVQDALRDIGESTSGNKDKLIQKLQNNWKSHNRDVYELLDFTDKESLEMICYYYNLDPTPAKHDILKRRIKKAKLLSSGYRPTAQVNKSEEILEPKIKPKTFDEILEPKSKIPNKKSSNTGSYIKNHMIQFVLTIIGGLVVTIISALLL